MARKKQRRMVARHPVKRRFRTLFVIAAEGSKTEPQYFRMIRYLSPDNRVDIVKKSWTATHYEY